MGINMLRAISCALVLFFTSDMAAAKETRLVFATTSPASYDFVKEVLTPWAERINEQGKGVIKIDVRYGPTAANHLNFVDRVRSDVVQIAWGLQAHVGGEFSLTELTAVPFLIDNAEVGAVALWRLYKEGGLASDYTDIVPLFLTAFPQTALHMNAPLASLDNLGGAKVIALSRMQSDVISGLGGTPISLPITDMYEAIQRRTVDGTSVQWSAFAPFNLAEVTKYHVDAPLGGAAGMVFMSKRRYEALPEAARKILEQNSGESQSRTFGAFWDRAQAEGRSDVQARGGHTIATLNAQQLATWRAMSLPAVEKWKSEKPGRAKALDRYKELVKEVQAEHAKEAKPHTLGAQTQ